MWAFAAPLWTVNPCLPADLACALTERLHSPPWHFTECHSTDSLSPTPVPNIWSATYCLSNWRESYCFGISCLLLDQPGPTHIYTHVYARSHTQIHTHTHTHKQTWAQKIRRHMHTCTHKQTCLPCPLLTVLHAVSCQVPNCINGRAWGPALLWHEG